MRSAIEHGASTEELLAVVELTVSSHASKPLVAGTRGIQQLLDEKKKP